MKHFHLILLAALSSVSTTVCAQIKMFSNGNTLMGKTSSSSNPLSQLSINSNGDSQYRMYLYSDSLNGMYIYNRGLGNYTTNNNALYVTCSADGGKPTTGIYVNASIGTTNDQIFGVSAKASGRGAMGGYGLCGTINHSTATSTKYTGVFGSSTSSTVFTTDGHYAGFFRGDVRVTGSLYGTLLTPTSAQGGSSTVVGGTDDRGESVSDKLSTVDLLQSYQEDNSVVLDTKTLRQNAQSGAESIPSTAEEAEAMSQAFEGGEDVTVVNVRKSAVRYGLDAEGLRKVYPELVYEDNYGNMSINYIEMVPLLVKANNELREEIRQLKAELNGDEKMSETKDRTTALAGILDETKIISHDQNDPKPFSERTSIGMNIPKEVKSATLYIYDMSGKQVEAISVTARGKAFVSVAGQKLTAGMYLYSLVCDGEVISTKRMILTR